MYIKQISFIVRYTYFRIVTSLFYITWFKDKWISLWHYCV